LLVDQLAKPEIPFDPATIRKGVITASNPTATPPSVDLTISGDDSATISAVRYIDSYSPVVGDTVLIIKQGTDIVVLGQINDSGSGSENGWQNPTLGSGFSNNGNSNGNPAYRLIVDNGDLKIQWKGSVAKTGTATALCTMPTGYRPASTRNVLTARDPGGGANDVQLQFNTDGTVVVVGGTTVPAMAGGGTTSSAGGHSHTVFDDHTHSHQGYVPVTSFVDSGTDTQGSHTHTGGTPTATVTFPTWISLNGVEYFL
jgi:hypothetical protein